MALVLLDAADREAVGDMDGDPHRLELGTQRPILQGHHGAREVGPLGQPAEQLEQVERRATVGKLMGEAQEPYGRGIAFAGCGLEAQLAAGSQLGGSPVGIFERGLLGTE
jgi:hypothetical protein